MKKKDVKPEPHRIENRKARHDYHILETWEAGLALQGPEVKSIRLGKASLQDSYAQIERGELYLFKVHITPYAFTHHIAYDPLRKRKLLMHRSELKKLEGRVQEKGLTLIPLNIHFTTRGIAKVDIALAKGKNAPDRREDIKRRDQERDARRELR